MKQKAPTWQSGHGLVIKNLLPFDKRVQVAWSHAPPPLREGSQRTIVAGDLAP
jgi:hypothetical protein